MTPRMEKWIRRLMALTVLAVAIFAAIQSYTHHFDLAQTHHESGASLRLYPLSVDWLMLAAGLVYLVESHKHKKRPKLPMAVLGVGIAATLAGNVGALWIYGPVAVLVGAWGPVCLVLTIEMGMYLVRSLSHEAKEAKTIVEIGGEAPATHAWAAGVPEVKGTDLVTQEVSRSPGFNTEGWGQLGRQEPAPQGLDGIGLSNGR